MPRMHDISDGFALVGFRSKPNRIRNFNSEYPNIEGDLHINNLPLVEWVNQFHHGNHVPEVEAPNPAIYLRNDNTWQEIKPDHIGAAPDNVWESLMPVGFIYTSTRLTSPANIFGGVWNRFHESFPYQWERME